MSIFKYGKFIQSLFVELIYRDYYIITASVHPYFHNWGDDVSLELARLINPKSKFIIKKYTLNLRNRENILSIGSIITWMTTENSIIWGSGVVYPEKEISALPKKVLSVRGPLTRKYLLSQGIPCPEIYGDPALLFPQYYQPLNNFKRYKLGIIPHFRDKGNQILDYFKNNADVTIIDVQDFSDWRFFIDRICECSYIVSSSLHGVIISDTYMIPNQWVHFPNGESKTFAFNDYYLSVNKLNEMPFNISKNTTIKELIVACSKWVKPTIDLNKLIEVCPFK